MSFENLVSSISHLSTLNMVLVGAIVLVLFWLLLELLVAYSVEFLVLGIVGYTVMMAHFPMALPSGLAGYVLMSGVGLFILMLLTYEFVLWQRSKKMKSIARTSLLGFRYHPRYRSRRGSNW